MESENFSFLSIFFHLLQRNFLERNKKRLFEMVSIACVMI